jgi:hypothetical protein
MGNLKDIFMKVGGYSMEGKPKTLKPVPMSGSRISYQHLQFQQVPITMHSYRGTEYTSWVDIGMPRISKPILDCVSLLSGRNYLR